MPQPSTLTYAEAMAELDRIVERAYEQVWHPTPEDPNAAVFDRIDAALAQKGVLDWTCAVCGGDDWSYGDGYILPTVHYDPSRFRDWAPEGVYPLLPVFCDRCGNTVLLSPLVLGFTVDELPGLRLEATDANV